MTKLKEVSFAGEYQNALNVEVSALLKSGFELDAFADRSILVTGATGQIGSSLVRLLKAADELLDLGLKIYAGCRDERRFSGLCDSLINDKNVAYVFFDCDTDFLPEDVFDYVIHCAGYGDPKAFVNDPVGIMRSNINGLDKLLQLLRIQEYGRLLYVSSGEVYGQGEGGVASFDESYSGYVNTMSPRSCYQISKRAGETLLASYCSQYGIDALVARQCHVFGPGYSPRDTRVVAQFFNNVRADEDIVMKSAGSQTRSYIFEIDAVAAYLALLLSGESGQAYNIAPDYNTSILGFAKALCKQTGNELSFADECGELRSGYGNISRSVLNPKKINDLGWNNVFSLEEGLRTTIKSFNE